MATKLKTRILHKIDTEERWTTNNPVLRVGEIGFTADGEHKSWFKLGDGVTPWTELKYAYSEFMANLLAVDNLTIEMTDRGIAIKDTGVVAGDYSTEYDEENDIFKVPSFTVNSKGQLTEIVEKRIQIKQTMSVIPVTGSEYTVSSNHALIAGKSTDAVNCVIYVPYMPTGTQVVVKNVSPNNALIVRPSGVSIDYFTGDIMLSPFEYITLVSVDATMWSIISESSRFDTTKFSSLNLSSDIIVRTDSTGNTEQNISSMNLDTNDIAIV